MPRGIKYNKAIKAVSSTSRKAKRITVIHAIKIKASRYCQRRERNEELYMLTGFIIPFERSWLKHCSQVQHCTTALGLPCCKSTPSSTDTMIDDKGETPGFHS